MKKYRHITDVGAASGDGADSTLRILDQYELLGIDANVISAGNGPLRVAFLGTTQLQNSAHDRVAKLLGGNMQSLGARALNCAPRNADEKKADAAEDYIYRVITPGQPDLVLYGPKVLEYVVNFRGRAKTVVDRIYAINGVIDNTSKGSQFRSAEYLPIAHYLQIKEELDGLADRDSVDIDDILDFELQSDEFLVLPPDEFNNGRVLVSKDTFNKIGSRKGVSLGGFATSELDGNRDVKANVCSSLTDVTPGELAIWQSSNHFGNNDLVVLNVGTRWASGKTSIVNSDILGLIDHFTNNVGTTCKITF